MMKKLKLTSLMKTYRPFRTNNNNNKKYGKLLKRWECQNTLPLS